MDKSLVYQLTVKSFPTSTAYLKDYKKLTSHLGYPYILPHKGFKVEGFLIRDIDPQTMKRLDKYEDEGRLYFRKRLTAVSSGKEVLCDAYVGNPTILQLRCFT
jgi:gamma-glutamylcyclotransferase (GGCT)/AIG2-like uncharacterized protein YtfP